MQKCASCSGFNEPDRLFYTLVLASVAALQRKSAKIAKSIYNAEIIMI